MSKNDERILKLKNDIAEQKQNLKPTRFSPITNCIVAVDSITYNLNVLQKEMLIFLMVKLNGYSMSAKDLGLESFTISEYDIQDWIGDIQGRLDQISFKEKEKQLKVMENKLDKLLSDDKKTELELDDIENFLK